MSETRWILETLGGEPSALELPQSGSVVIGSARERAGFLLEGQGVDEAHCAVGRTKEGDWAVKDLGSRHGTLLNGQRVAAARLKLGDQLVLGSRRLEVKLARNPAASVGSARPSDVPQRVNGYRVERLIGRGGMGAVYLAVQESLRRPVALKILAPHLAADRDFVHRFQAEARAAAALSHPNVVVVYDVGEEAGAHYLSMEFMAGGSLEQKLAAAGPLPWKTVLGVLTDAAAGLAYAESRGIVHRDIKPANLMYSGTGTVKIADLGLATTVEQEASEGVGEGGRKVYGTPHFISPEQARGQAVDHRSDLYSLGATAYRLLSGRTAFEGATTRDILRALQTESPPPLRTLVPDLPGELEALIVRLMEKDPAARFPSAEALRRECERLRLVAEHGQALATPRGARLQGLLALALLLVVGASTAAWFLFGRTPPSAPPREVGNLAPEDPPESELQDPDFFGGEESASEGGDEEAALRARERLAAQALREIPAFLEGEERRLALERVRDEHAGTEGARQAARELEALSAAEHAGDAGPTLAEATQALHEEVERTAAAGGTLADLLATIEAHHPPPSLAAPFEVARAAEAAARIQAEEAALRAGFEHATALALDGSFDALRTQLDSLDARLKGLSETDERLAPLRVLLEDLAARRARVDEEERFYLANRERAQRRELGAALGPGSGLLAELVGLDFAALDARFSALSPELRARPYCVALEHELELARALLASLRETFAQGHWRRKSLLDPRSRKVREVRDVLPTGLAFERDGGLETVAWREAHADPDWWHQLFQARLDRDWSPQETRGIVALLRLMGASRGAEVAREMIDPRGRGLLQPAELESLGNVFDPALNWLATSADEGGQEAAALALERASAQRLARALTAAQARAWSAAAAEIERLLGASRGGLLVGLLTEGADWREERGELPPAVVPAGGR